MNQPTSQLTNQPANVTFGPYAERGALPWKEALRILEQIAGALDYAHGKGLIRRDVKPVNIILSEEEGAVLTDFGLVRACRL